MEDEKADAADRSTLPAAIASEAAGDSVELAAALTAAGLDERQLRVLCSKHAIAFDEVKSSLARMEEMQEARHRELRSYLKGNARDKPADVIEWADVETYHVVGEGAFGQVFMGIWAGSTVAIKMIRGVLDSKTLERVYEEANLMSSMARPAACLPRFLLPRFTASVESVGGPAPPSFGASAEASPQRGLLLRHCLGQTQLRARHGVLCGHAGARRRAAAHAAAAPLPARRRGARTPATEPCHGGRLPSRTRPPPAEPGLPPSGRVTGADAACARCEAGALVGAPAAGRWHRHGHGAPARRVFACAFCSCEMRACAACMGPRSVVISDSAGAGTRVGPHKRPIVHGDLKVRGPRCIVMPTAARLIAPLLSIAARWPRPDWSTRRQAGNVLLCAGSAFDSARFIPKICDFGCALIFHAPVHFPCPLWRPVGCTSVG